MVSEFVGVADQQVAQLVLLQVSPSVICRLAKVLLLADLPDRFVSIHLPQDSALLYRRVSFAYHRLCLS